MDIYVQKDGQQHGPFAETRIREGIDAGEFVPTDLAWTKGKASWQPLSVLIDLDLDEPPPLSGLCKEISAALPPTTVHPSVPGSPLAIDVLHPTLPSTLPSKPPSRRQTSNSVQSTGEPLSSRIYKSIAWLIIVSAVLIAAGGIIWLNGQLPKPSPDLLELEKSIKGHQDPPEWKYQDSSKDYKKTYSSSEMAVTAHHAGLWDDEKEFVREFGSPVQIAHGAEPPASDDLFFVATNDLVYEVSFWRDGAHHVNVYRKDLGELTEAQIQQGLKAFSGGEDWDRKLLSGVFGGRRWERSGTAAWIVEARKEYPNDQAKLPVTVLRISTNEFWDAYVEANRGTQ